VPGHTPTVQTFGPVGVRREREAVRTFRRSPLDRMQHVHTPTMNWRIYTIRTALVSSLLDHEREHPVADPSRCLLPAKRRQVDVLVASSQAGPAPELVVQRCAPLLLKPCTVSQDAVDSVPFPARCSSDSPASPRARMCSIPSAACGTARRQGRPDELSVSNLCPAPPARLFFFCTGASP
jgi:hypothetical protein